MAELGSIDNIKPKNETYGFRAAAAAGDKNVGKIVKDIYSALPKKELGELTSASQEMAGSIQQVSTKVDTTNSLMQESVQTQNLMLAELKSIKTSMKGLSEYFEKQNEALNNPIEKTNYLKNFGGIGNALTIGGLPALVNGPDALSNSPQSYMPGGNIPAAKGTFEEGRNDDRMSVSGYASMDVKSGIKSAAAALGISPVDLATAISYETGGTFDPTKKGPTTQYGQHKGLIQFGEPQAEKYGVDWNDPVRSQLGPDGAVVKYLKDAGVKPGMGLMDIYSAINAGHVGKYDASDANNGGAPGTVADKVNTQMAGHKQKAEEMFANDSSMQQSYAEPFKGGAGMRNGMLPDNALQPIGQGGLKAQPAAAGAFKEMAAAAAKDGVRLKVTDAYRTFDEQVDLKRRKGRLAATPGRSNHGWGLAFDIDVGGGNEKNSTFAWLKENAHRFGFKGPLQSPYEPWHWEYSGGGSGGTPETSTSPSQTFSQQENSYIPSTSQEFGQDSGSSFMPTQLNPMDSVFSGSFAGGPAGVIDQAANLLGNTLGNLASGAVQPVANESINLIDNNAKESRAKDEIAKDRMLEGPVQSKTDIDQPSDIKIPSYKSDYNSRNDRNLYGEGDWVKDIFGAFGLIAQK